MRTTRHGAAEPSRERRRAIGLTVALLAVGVVVCLAGYLQGRVRPTALEYRGATAAES